MQVVKHPRAVDLLWYGCTAGLAGTLAIVLRRSGQRLEREQQTSHRAESETYQASRLRDHLLASASHDVRSPLASAKLLIHLLQRQADRGTIEPGHLRERLDLIGANLDRVSALIGELLDVARLQGGSPLELHTAPMDLVPLVRRLVAGSRETAGDGRIALLADQESLLGDWDASRLERALQNLVNNAIQYSSAGSEVLIRLTREQGDHQPRAVISVEDRGLGIPREDLPHIFEWFRRGRNVQHISGTGVGLASAKQVVEQHGGSLEVRSNPGGGTTFTMRLPLQADRQREDVRLEEAPTPLKEAQSSADHG